VSAASLALRHGQLFGRNPVGVWLTALETLTVLLCMSLDSRTTAVGGYPPGPFYHLPVADSSFLVSRFSFPVSRFRCTLRKGRLSGRLGPDNTCDYIHDVLRHMSPTNKAYATSLVGVMLHDDT